jgi:LPXTG-motif cell wall-anchored protein
VATVIAVVTTTTAPAVITTTTAPAVITTTTAAVELQVVTPENPNGTQDALDVLFPDVLPSAGNDSANSTLFAMILLFGGALLLTILTARRTRRN